MFFKHFLASVGITFQKITLKIDSGNNKFGQVLSILESTQPLYIKLHNEFQYFHICTLNLHTPVIFSQYKILRDIPG